MSKEAMSKRGKVRAPKAARQEHAPSGAAAGPATRQRIAKAMARAGLCSRREAETWIAQGRVSVNGEICATPAVNVGPHDVVLIDGAPLPLPDKTRLFCFHKPRGLVTSDHDPEGRKTVADFLRESWPDGPRVVTIGRLDINTEGLLLLTNDGGLARILELPETGWVRRYRVRAKGETDQAKLDALADGISIDGIDYAGIEAKLDRVQGANCWLTMGLREGKNREIKRVLEHLGLEVNRLIRLSFGPFQLLELTEGAVEEVPTRVLRDQLGAALAAKAGAIFEVADASSDPVGAASRRKPAERKERPQSPNRRSEGRPDRRRIETVEDVRPRVDRPAPGKRKHISTMRAERSERREAAGRTRIDRSQTVDRRDRVVQVERVAGRGRAEAGGRPGESEIRADDRPRRGHRGKLSPSAAGKRERIARSGGAQRQERPVRGGATADRAEARSRRPRDPSRPSESARPRPKRGGTDRAGPRKQTDAPSRSRSAGTQADRTENHSRKPGESRSPTQPQAKRGDKKRTAPRTQRDGSPRSPKKPSDRRTRRPDPKR